MIVTYRSFCFLIKVLYFPFKTSTTKPPTRLYDFCLYFLEAKFLDDQLYAVGKLVKGLNRIFT